jgi:glycosyltransferase involved in cell wall biosynthesis
MKILIFNWRCWLNPTMGGAEVFTYEVAKCWVRDGHEVTVFTAEYPHSKREEVVDGIRIVRAGGKYSVYGKAKHYYKKRFSKEKFDVVIDEINTKPFFAPKFVDNGEHMVALIHQLAREFWFYETFFPINYLGYHFFEKRWLSNYLDVPIAVVSDSTKQGLSALGFKNVHVVSQGLNFKSLPKLPEKENHPVIVFSGRLKRAKRPDHAIKAFKIIKDKLADAEFWIIGDGPFKRDLKKMAVEGVKFFGKLSNEERRALVERCWVLVHPSVREGWPLNIIEANALGTPCVGYDVPGLRDSVKNGETGLLTKNGDVKMLSKTLFDILSDDALRSNLSQNSLEYSRNFSWDKTAEELINVVTQKRVNYCPQ